MSSRTLEQRASDEAGIRALMLAVLAEGIRSYSNATGRTRQEAEDWIWAYDRRSPFCFTVICEVLGLEPSAVRKAIERLRPGVRRIRPNAGLGRHALRARRRRV